MKLCGASATPKYKNIFTRFHTYCFYVYRTLCEGSELHVALKENYFFMQIRTTLVYSSKLIPFCASVSLGCLRDLSALSSLLQPTCKDLTVCLDLIAKKNVFLVRSVVV